MPPVEEMVQNFNASFPAMGITVAEQAQKVEFLLAGSLHHFIAANYLDRHVLLVLCMVVRWIPNHKTLQHVCTQVFTLMRTHLFIPCAHDSAEHATPHAAGHFVSVVE